MYTRSFTHEDIPDGVDLPPEVSFQRRPWDIALTVMKKCGSIVDARCLGTARAARVRDGSRTPNAIYDEEDAARGAFEAAMLMLTMGDRHGAQLSYIRSVEEDGRLPWDRGWRPKAFAGNINDVLDMAVEMQAADEVLRFTSSGRVAMRLVSHIFPCYVYPPC